MMRRLADRAAIAHFGLIAFIFGLQFALPDYHHLVLARVMVLATFAIGYNVLFGYAGLLSLGHAMFFAAGLYGAGLTAYHLSWEAPAGIVVVEKPVDEDAENILLYDNFTSYLY